MPSFLFIIIIIIISINLYRCVSTYVLKFSFNSISSNISHIKLFTVDIYLSNVRSVTIDYNLTILSTIQLWQLLIFHRASLLRCAKSLCSASSGAPRPRSDGLPARWPRTASPLYSDSFKSALEICLILLSWFILWKLLLLFSLYILTIGKFSLCSIPPCLSMSLFRHLYFNFIKHSHGI